VILESLARVTPPVRLQREIEDAVRLVLFDLWNSMLLQGRERLLAGSWAGGVLERMKDHYRAETERAKAIADFEDPRRVQERREEKRRLKQQKHQNRLALKKDRDRIWRENQKKNKS
jgi:hypothetical protein